MRIIFFHIGLVARNTCASRVISIDSDDFYLLPSNKQGKPAVSTQQEGGTVAVDAVGTWELNVHRCESGSGG